MDDDDDDDDDNDDDDHDDDVKIVATTTYLSLIGIRFASAEKFKRILIWFCP